MAKRSTPRRALYPLPVDDLFAHPGYVALPAAGRGMLLSALENFWRSDCRSPPTNDDGWFSYVRAHRSTWRAHKDEIIAIFEAVRPGLEAYKRKRDGGHKGLSHAAHASNAARRLSALKEATARERQAIQPLPIREPNAPPPRPLPPTQRQARPQLIDRA
jgi:hypothetical protein